MKVLIGYDGSESGDAIFADLKHAGLPREVEAKVVSVADLFVNNAPASDFDMHSLLSRRVEMVLQRAEKHRQALIEETEVLADKAAGRLRAEFAEWEVASEVLTGTPAWELIDAANNFAADLVVIGSQGRSAIGGFFLGSVSKRLATDARCSVRVARATGPKNEDGVTRIVVGVDGSPAAEEMLFAVGRRVWPAGTEVRLVAVDDGTRPDRIAMRLPLAAGMINNYLNEQESRVSAMLDWATKELANIGVKASIVSEKGDPKNVLLEQARTWNADCIFVGTRDFNSAFERFRLGSVSTAVVTNAPCSVEIVRPHV